MSLGEDQIIAQQKNTFKHNSNCKNQKQYQEKKHAGTLREGKKILIIGYSHIQRVQRDKLQNSFDNAKSFVRYFSGAKTEDLHHYIIPALLKEKPDTVAIHIGSNNITHKIFEDFNADKLADEITDIGKMCRQYGVKDVIFSSIFCEKQY